MNKNEGKINMEKNGDIAGKYLSFSLREETYGIPIESVQEIIEMAPITYVPNLPDFVKGVINLRGKVLYVIDLRGKFGLEETSFTKETCIIIVDIGSLQLGVIVDSVYEVLEFKKENIEANQSLSDDDNDQFIIGMGKIDEKVIILADLSIAFSSESMKKIIRPDNQAKLNSLIAENSAKKEAV